MRSPQRLLTAALVLTPVFASASIVSITSGDTVQGNHGSNLILNGSFEADAGFAANHSYWATGTALSPTMSLTDWQATGVIGSYADWGNDGNGRLNGSDLIPDGANALYFGGGIMAPPSLTPNYNPDGTVTFAGTPTFFPKPTDAPVTLSQTVTGLNVGQNYLLDFWASGEDAIGGQFFGDGIFGLDITGENQLYFAAPDGVSGLGQSQRYFIVFKPTVSTTTFTWTNWGHYPTPNGLTTELVLDDVILNAQPTPEPATVAGLAIASLAFLRRRRAKRL